MVRRSIGVRYSMPGKGLPRLGASPGISRHPASFTHARIDLGGDDRQGQGAAQVRLAAGPVGSLDIHTAVKSGFGRHVHARRHRHIGTKASVELAFATGQCHAVCAALGVSEATHGFELTLPARRCGDFGAQAFFEGRHTARPVPRRRMGRTGGCRGRAVTPDRGDILHLAFDPARGREMKGNHFCLVVSPKAFNARFKPQSL